MTEETEEETEDIIEAIGDPWVAGAGTTEDLPAVAVAVAVAVA